MLNFYGRGVYVGQFRGVLVQSYKVQVTSSGVFTLFRNSRTIKGGSIIYGVSTTSGVTYSHYKGYYSSINGREVFMTINCGFQTTFTI